MAKTIKITLYTPKELWVKFWNWAFWPRRKICAEWMEVMQVWLENKIISDILIGKYYRQEILSEAAVDSLELDIKAAIEDECEKMAKLMSKPA